MQSSLVARRGFSQMGKRLTDSDVSALRDLVDNRNRSKYYSQLSDWGYDYPGLAGKSRGRSEW